MKFRIAIAAAAFAVSTAHAQTPVLVIPPAPAAASEALAWTIDKDERIDLALQRWAAKAGWTVTWSLPMSWECPTVVTFKGDLPSTVVQVVEALNRDGKHLRLRIYDSSRYMEVVSDAAN